MALPAPFRAALEILLNRALALDPETAEALGAFEGRVIGLALHGGDGRLLFLPGRGRLHLLAEGERPPDALVRVTPQALLRLPWARHPAEGLFRGEVTFEGDTALAQGFLRTLGRLEIDWEELLARVMGDPAAHALGRLVRTGVDRVAGAAALLQQDLGEYLTEEARLVPTRAEVEDFAEQVERLREDLDRLEARVRRLAGQGPEAGAAGC